MRFLDAAARSLHTLEVVPEIGDLRRLLGIFVLVAHTVDSAVEQVGVAERQLDGCFEGPESGERYNPVAEDAVVQLLVLDTGRKLALGERVCLWEILLEQRTLREDFDGKMCQPHIAERDKFLVFLAFLLCERRFGESEEYQSRKERHVLCGLVLTAQRKAGRHDGLRRHSVGVGVLLGLTAATPYTFEVSYLAHIKVVLVFIEYNERVHRLRNAVVHRRN